MTVPEVCVFCKNALPTHGAECSAPQQVVLRKYSTARAVFMGGAWSIVATDAQGGFVVLSEAASPGVAWLLASRER